MSFHVISLKTKMNKIYFLFAEINVPQNAIKCGINLADCVSPVRLIIDTPHNVSNHSVVQLPPLSSLKSQAEERTFFFQYSALQS